MDNNKIKEAWDIWVGRAYTQDERNFDEDHSSSTVNAAAFHGGYTAADREWREKVEKVQEWLNYHQDYEILEGVNRILGLDSSNKE